MKLITTALAAILLLSACKKEEKNNYNGKDAVIRLRQIHTKDAGLENHPVL